MTDGRLAALSDLEQRLVTLQTRFDALLLTGIGPERGGGGAAAPPAPAVNIHEKDMDNLRMQVLSPLSLSLSLFALN